LTVALTDLCNALEGEPGGELAIAGWLFSLGTKRNATCGVSFLDLVWVIVDSACRDDFSPPVPVNFQWHDDDVNDVGKWFGPNASTSVDPTSEPARCRVAAAYWTRLALLQCGINASFGFQEIVQRGMILSRKLEDKRIEDRRYVLEVDDSKR
jgi:hypothetical protein